MKIPGLTYSWKRAVGVTQAKQKIARKTGIPTSKQGIERKIGSMILDILTHKQNIHAYLRRESQDVHNLRIIGSVIISYSQQSISHNWLVWLHECVKLFIPLQCISE